MTSAVQTRHCLFGKASRAPDVPQAIQNQYTGTFAKQEAAWRIKTSLINCIDDKTTTRLTNSFIATRANYSLAMSELGQNAKFRGDRRMSALAPKADISRFMSTRPRKIGFQAVQRLGKQFVFRQSRGVICSSNSAILCNAAGIAPHAWQYEGCSPQSIVHARN